MNAGGLIAEILAASASLSSCSAGAGGPPETGFPVHWQDVCPGDVTLIVETYETSETGEGSSGSSRGSQAIKETVISVSPQALQVEIDLPDTASDRERQSQWHMPAILDVTPDGQYSIRNETEMMSRLDEWLVLAGADRAACGEWIFTWNAFEIDCDPNTVAEAYGQADLRSLQAQAGAAIDDDLAQEPSVLVPTENPNRFEARFDIDPAAVREMSSEQSFILSRFVDDPPMTMEQARARHAEDKVEGTVHVTLTVDEDGQTVTRDVVIDDVLEDADGGRTSRKKRMTTQRAMLFEAPREDGRCLQE